MHIDRISLRTEILDTNSEGVAYTLRFNWKLTATGIGHSYTQDETRRSAHYIDGENVGAEVHVVVDIEIYWRVRTTLKSRVCAVAVPIVGAYLKDRTVLSYDNFTTAVRRLALRDGSNTNLSICRSSEDKHGHDKASEAGYECVDFHRVAILEFPTRGLLNDRSC